MFNEVQVVSCIRGGVEMKCYADVLHFHYQDWYDEWPSVICMCVCLHVCIPVCLFVNKYVLFVIGTKHDSRTDSDCVVMIPILYPVHLLRLHSCRYWRQTG